MIDADLGTNDRVKRTLGTRVGSVEIIAFGSA